MNSMMLSAAAFCASTGCEDQRKPSAAKEAVDPAERRLLEIARTYRTYGRLQEMPEWAAIDCRAPSPPHSVARRSGSNDVDTHGQKLFYIFSGKPEAYLGHAGTKQPVGQVLVKESWTASEVADDGSHPLGLDGQVELPSVEDKAADPASIYARQDGKLYRADRQANLFIMFKTEANTSETDDGWIYGVVQPDGKSVIAAGKIASCMQCHRQAKHDRVFGLASPRFGAKKPGSKSVGKPSK